MTIWVSVAYDSNKGRYHAITLEEIKIFLIVKQEFTLLDMCYNSTQPPCKEKIRRVQLTRKKQCTVQ